MLKGGFRKRSVVISVIAKGQLLEGVEVIQLVGHQLGNLIFISRFRRRKGKSLYVRLRYFSVTSGILVVSPDVRQAERLGLYIGN